MNDIARKSNVLRFREFVGRHKTQILVGLLLFTTTGMILTRLGLKQHDGFLRDKGLYDEYYATFEE